MSTDNTDEDIRVRRARIEEIRPLSDEYRDEASVRSRDGRPWDPPVPQGGVFWIAEDTSDVDEVTSLGYAGGTLRPEGITIGPVFVRGDARRRGVGFRLLRAIQNWAEDTRVPVVEVSVAMDNEEGKDFLEAAGYVPRRILFSLTPGARTEETSGSGEGAHDQ